MWEKQSILNKKKKTFSYLKGLYFFAVYCLMGFSSCRLKSISKCLGPEVFGISFFFCLMCVYGTCAHACMRARVFTHAHVQGGENSGRLAGQ